MECCLFHCGIIIVACMQILYFCRKVVTETATGSTISQRVKTTLTVEVANIEFDTQGGTIHVKGKNAVENKHVKVSPVSEHGNTIAQLVKHLTGSGKVLLSSPVPVGRNKMHSVRTE